MNSDMNNEKEVLKEKDLHAEEAKKIAEELEEEGFPSEDEYLGVQVRKKRNFYFEESNTEIAFYFDPTQFRITKREAEEMIAVLITFGSCTGSDCDRVRAGEIRVYLNPLYHDARTRDSIIEQVIRAIRETAIDKG